jgi:hypothetical protein
MILPGSLLPASAADRPAPKDDPAFLEKAALSIDKQVANYYRRQRLEVPPVTNDAKFLRRAFLVTTGRIPTAEEARFFLEIDEETKREELVAYLLQSNGYSSHLTNWAFDLLRVVDRKSGSRSAFEPYRHWVRTAMEENMPWDQFTTRLLASEGNGWDPGTAAVGYYTRDRGMPFDNLANSMRVFLGSHMECAQCHDDPFGDTERHDFYQLAAFTHGQGEMKKGLMKGIWDEVREDDRRRTVDYRVAEVLWDRVYGQSLAGGGKGRIPLPSDYQYRDGQPGEIVGARTPFGKTVRMSDRNDGKDGRKQLAEWVTNRNPDRFPQVIANRMWKRVMGTGLYEPIDDYLEANGTHHPELVALLGRLMVEVEYDLRAFQNILLLTRTFQFNTNPNPSKAPNGGDDFHGRQVARLSAEQIWDSLVTLAAGNPDKMPRRTLDDRIYVAGKPVLAGKKNMVQLSREVLALSSESELRAYFRQLVQEVKNGGGGGGSDSMMMSGQPVRYGRDSMVRASELPSPAPREHFLYLFGQSDREVVEGASHEPNVGQVLSLMNGFVQRKLVNNSSAHVYRSLEGASTEEEKIRRLYVATLNRPPDSEEMAIMLDEVKASGEDGYRNIVSALVMSSEFLFLQ